MLKKVVLVSLVSSLSSFSQGAELFKKPFRLKIAGEAINIEAGYAYPSFADLSGDGVKDLIVGGYGNQGRIHFFEASLKKSSISFAEGKPLEFSDRDGPLYVSGVK